MSYELLIKGGTLVDPAQGINGRQDICVDRGKVAAVAPNIPASEAERIIEAHGLIVTPGLIDIHTHVAETIIPIAVAPGEAGVFCGVTTVCDAGSTGYTNLDAFKKFVIPQAQTDVFCFLHLSPIGEAILPEIGYQDIDASRMLETIEKNRDIIKGIKIRAIAGVMKNPGIELVKTAKRIALRAGLPIVIHLGIDQGEAISEDISQAFVREMLSLLDEGDVLTHVFTKKQGGVIRSDGSVVDGLREAVERGVALDVGSAIGHLNFEVARKGIELGILPTTLSTDFTTFILNGPVPFSMPVLMSEFLALGLSLYQVVEMSTINPARVLGEEQRRGSLAVGMPADITIYKLAEGDSSFVDSRDGDVLRGEQLLVPRQTLKRGVEIDILPRFSSYAQWSYDVDQMLAQKDKMK